MQIRYRECSNTHIIYDQDVLPVLATDIFDHQAQQDRCAQDIPGRGAPLFFHFRGVDMNLKRYRRGGMVRHVIKSSYLYPGLKRTRMWREFHLLADMRELGLPVPQPIAARCERLSPFSYRGDLVTRKIANTRTLSEHIRQASLSDDQWSCIGRVIADFHRHDVYHADLNANNILMDDRGAVFLIDFDKGEYRSNTRQHWKRRNLERLLRSLNKLRGLHPALHFTFDDWKTLQSGYSELKARRPEESKLR